MLRPLASTLVLLAAPLALAAGPAAPTQPPEFRRLVASFTGVTQGTMTLTAGDQKLSLTGTRTCRAAGNGLGLQCQLKGDIQGMGPYEASELFGFNAETGKVHLYTVTSMGEVHDHAGSFGPDGSLKLEFVGTRGGKAYVERIHVTLAGDGSQSMQCEELLEGKQVSTLQGVWRTSRRS